MSSEVLFLYMQMNILGESRDCQHIRICTTIRWDLPAPFQFSADSFKTIVVVTRPLLFCCMKKVFESPREVASLTSSRKLRHLLLVSLEASQKILTILENLQEQGLLGNFPLL